MTYYNNTELYHHGIKGQKWGVRRFKKENGQLTPAGKERYSKEERKKKLKKVAKIAGISVGVIGALLIGKTVVEHFVQRNYNTKVLKGHSEHIKKGHNILDDVLERQKSVDPKKLRWNNKAAGAWYNERRKIWNKYELFDDNKIWSPEESKSMMDELHLLDERLARIKKKLGTEHLYDDLFD